MAKILISEQTIFETAKRGENIIYIDENTIITPSARDRAKQLGINFSQKVEKSPLISSPKTGQINTTGSGETIAIGSDHGGFSLKEALKPFLVELGYKVVDVGTYSEDACDYPDFAYAVAKMVMSGDASRGIMIDAVGVASAIAANKLPGIRAACCFNEFSARSSREHNDTNVLTLGARVMGVEFAKAITKIWLETQFSGDRHQKRIEKISEIEKKYLKNE